MDMYTLIKNYDDLYLVKIVCKDFSETEQRVDIIDAFLYEMMIQKKNGNVSHTTLIMLSA